MTSQRSDHHDGQTIIPPPGATVDHRRPAAVLWDFDGTLVDTEPVWMQAQYRLVESLGGRWTDEDCHNMIGNSLLDSGAYLVAALEAQGIGSDGGEFELTPAGIVERLVAEVLAEVKRAPIPWRPGAEQLLSELRVAGVPQALVSASYQSLLDAVVERLPAGSFSVVVAGDAVTHGKPHPEPYLTGCERLAVSPSECLALEDSIPGCESGNAAGCVVVAIHNLVDVPAAPHRVRIDSLVGVDVGELYALFSRGRG